MDRIERGAIAIHVHRRAFARRSLDRGWCDGDILAVRADGRGAEEQKAHADNRRATGRSGSPTLNRTRTDRNQTPVYPDYTILK
jgi:hypothetical protein